MMEAGWGIKSCGVGVGVGIGIRASYLVFYFLYCIERIYCFMIDVVTSFLGTVTERGSSKLKG